MAKAPITTRTGATSKSRTRATTSRKTRTSLKDIAEATPVVVPSIDAESTEDLGLDVMRKKELIESAVARAGIKKRDAKPAIEAALAIIGETLSAGRGLNMPELGKLKVQNSKNLEDAQVVNLRLRRKTGDPQETEEEGLAEPDE